MPFHNKDGIPEVINLIPSVKEIVSYFKHSVKASDELRKAQKDSEIELKLIQSVVTRWNSTFYFLERFVKLLSVIALILLIHSNAPNMLSENQINVVKDLIEIYRPLEVLTKEVSASKKPMSVIVIPLMNSLTKNLQNTVPLTLAGSQTKDIILQDIRKRFGKIENVEILAISTILDPKFKKIHFNSSISCSKAISKIKSMLTVPQKNRIENTVLQEEQEDNDLWSFHKRLAIENQTGYVANAEDETQCELRTYLMKPVSDFKTDSLLYWCDKKNESVSNIWNIALRCHSYIGPVRTFVFIRGQYSY